MANLAEYVDGLPNISGSEERIRQAIQASRTDPVFLPQGASGFGEINSAFAIALHMHQPLIPAGGPELRTARVISNLQWMLDNPDIGDNHNARVFLWCYRRMGEFVPQLLDEGFQPRVMLEYSGTLLYGLRQMGANDVLDALARITGDERDRRAVEWLGCPWGHAVAPSTPVQDYLCWLLGPSVQKSGVFGSVISLFNQPSLWQLCSIVTSSILLGGKYSSSPSVYAVRELKMEHLSQKTCFLEKKSV